MTLSAVGIGNLALDELPHRQIVSLDDNVLAAEVIKRQLPQVLGEIMESGEWNFGVRRLALTEITNDRTGRWGFAYATPNDMAIPLRIAPGPAVGGDFVGVGQTLATGVSFIGEIVPFDFEGRKLWSNERGLILEYITTSPEYADMSKRFERVLALSLASRIAVPITKDRDLKQKLLQELEIFGQRALASSLNNNATQNTYGDDFVPSSLRGHLEAPE